MNTHPLLRGVATKRILVAVLVLALALASTVLGMRRDEFDARAQDSTVALATTAVAYDATEAGAFRATYTVAGDGTLDGVVVESATQLMRSVEVTVKDTLGGVVFTQVIYANGLDSDPEALANALSLSGLGVAVGAGFAVELVVHGYEAGNPLGGASTTDPQAYDKLELLTTAAPSTPVAATETSAAPTTSAAPATETTSAAQPTTSAEPTTTTATTTAAAPQLRTMSLMALAPTTTSTTLDQGNFASAWLQSPGPLATQTHTLSTSGLTWTEKFQLGGNTGGFVTNLTYAYTGASASSYSINIASVKLTISGIIDSTNAGTPIMIRRDTAGNYYYGTYASGTQVGWRYPKYDATGKLLYYVDIYKLSSSLEIQVAFVDANGNPVSVEVPAHTNTTLTYTWNSVAPSVQPTTAKLTVTGTATGVSTDPIPPGGSDPALGQCTTSGGSVWVARSAHTDPNQTFNDRNTTQLYLQDYGSTSFTAVGPVTNWVYNALAYNPKDGYLYAISQGRIKTLASTGTSTPTYAEDPNYPAGHLLRISPTTGSVEDMGFVSGIQSGPVGTWPNDLWGGITSGVIMADGTFIFSNSSASGTKDTYTLSWNGTSYSLTAVRNTAANSQANDYSYFGDASSPYIYGMRNGTTILERIDTRTGAVATFDMAGQTDALGNTMPAGIYGTAWTYANGNLGFGLNGKQVSYQVKITSSTSTGFTAQLVSSAPAPTSQSNDAASNALVVGQSDLAVTKKLVSTASGVATWQITVTNVGPCGSSGFSVTDFVPSTYSNVAVSFDGSGWVSQTTSPDLKGGVQGNTVVALHGGLAVGQQAVLTLTATYDQATTKCVENTASVLGNEVDPQAGNNSSADGICSVRVEKSVVDVNGDGIIDAADGATPGPTPGTRQITYNVVVTNPDTTKSATYSLSDMPRFSSLVTVISASVVDPTGATKTLVAGSDGSYVLATNKSIAPLAVDKYQVTVVYSAPDQSGDFTSGECTASGDGAGHGLFNSATVSTATSSFTSSACAPITKDKDVSLFIRKVDAAQNTQPLSGAAFAVYLANPDGTPGVLVATLDSPDVNNPDFYTAILKPDTPYLLVETKSPVGYSLLPAPVAFTITRDAQGNAAVVLPPDSTSTSVVNDLVSTDPDPSHAYITVADVHQGALPVTGGGGYYLWLTAAALVVLIGSALALRRSHH